MRWEFKRLAVRAKKNFGRAFCQLFDDSKSALRELFVQIPKDIKIFAQTLWSYKGFLWSDRNYDHAFILQVLQLKIRRTKEYIGKHQRHTRWELDVKNMQKAEDMIEAILTASHDEALREAHDAKWGKAKPYFVPTGDSLGGSYMRSDRPKVHTDKERAQERKEYSAMIKKSMKLEEKAWSKLWVHLDKNMRNWWD